ncbi:MAG TPA: GIY-YIG nuclease family protein [Bacteroidales bacterium]|nr:GIY-YIG nuclease family protein [Bacteroidales bacterium]
MIIYKATNEINGMSYIGQTVNTLKIRKGQHIRSTKTPFHKALLEYGEDNFKWAVLCECESIEEMNEKEVYYINHFNTLYPKGYNMIEGDSGITHELTRIRLSDSMKGNANGSKRFLILTPQKECVIVENLKKYCKEFGINYCKMTFVANGRRLHHKGYLCVKFDDISDIDSEIERLRSVKFGRDTSGYILTTPEGEEIQIDDLVNFCKKYPELNKYGFYRILKGKTTPYKGWKIRRVGDNI